MGPLKGYRIIELAGLGPAPFCGMMLADMGAEVIQIVRASSTQNQVKQTSASVKRPINVDMRGRRSLALDLKNPQAIEVVLKLCESADGFIEGFRPGVVERLGIGPETCRQRNPKLVYGRMTGWGQNGPLAQRSGHDINYVAIGGALYNIGRKGEKPTVPMNYVGDYGGGAMMLAFGLLCGILEAQKSGKGQVVDAAMVDGVAALQAFHYEFYHYNLYKERGTHFLSGAHHSYDTYETKDGQFMAVGAVEAKFHDELVDKLGLDKVRFANKSIFEAFLDEKQIQPLKEEITCVFKTKTRDEWCKVFEGSDACVVPVLTIDEAAAHPHNVARNTFIKREGVLQHAPAPRFDRTVPEVGSLPRFPGEDSESILRELGLSEQEIKELQR